MYESEIAQLMIKFLKTVFENTYSTMTMFQEQSERMVMLNLEEINCFSAKDKRVLEEWISNCKKAQEDYKDFMKDYLDSIEDSLAATTTTSRDDSS